jgi:hypothetical protein
MRAAIHTVLDPTSFSSVWTEGEATTLEQAIDYALEPAG